MKSNQTTLSWVCYYEFTLEFWIWQTYFDLLLHTTDQTYYYKFICMAAFVNDIVIDISNLKKVIFQLVWNRVKRGCRK